MKPSGTPPPERFAPGGRRVLDAQWLAYLVQTKRIGDGSGIESPDLLGRGIAEFNAMKFRASHETWEGLWVNSAYPDRLFLLALTKFGAGFAHAQRHNAKGVRHLLRDALRFARPFSPEYAGINMSRLISDVDAWLVSGGLGPPYPELRTVS